MTLQIEGVWCKTRTEFEKLAKSGNYDLTISYFDIVNLPMVDSSSFDIII